MWNPFKKYTLDSLDFHIPREELLRRSRILIVDDEKPDIIQDLKRSGFSVDYEADINQENLDMIERSTYDLIILDFGSVGLYFGADQGLSLLKHLKRVNPTAKVLAYTSKALSTEHADFFRLTDGVLAKDAGIGDSMEQIEQALRSAQDIKHLWKGLLHAAGVLPNSKQDLVWQDLYVRGLRKPKQMPNLASRLNRDLGSELAKKVSTIILEKLVEAGAKWVIGV